MTAKENKAYQNIIKWRNLSRKERQVYGHKSVISEVRGSMAMESEPVSEKWLKQNAR